MLVKTKYFGEIDLTEDKIITFDQGIMGFEDLKRYTILYDSEGGKRPNISWLQCVDEQALALPVINPFLVKEDYNPVVEDELLKSIGEINEENLVILLALTVPTDITKMSANLKAPFIINADTRKGCQIIVENQDYEVKYYIYNILKKQKDEKGEK
ncbi:MAG: Flagellar assembly factor FliW [Lachnoclostridium sp.]|jgi:flagellar assembly factor FliW